MNFLAPLRLPTKTKTKQNKTKKQNSNESCFLYYIVLKTIQVYKNLSELLYG